MKILGMNYSISMMDASIKEAKNFGEHDGTTLTIRLASGMSRQHIESTLLHEVIEAISFQLGLDFEERTILALERGLYGVLVDGGVNLKPLLAEVYEAQEK